MLLKESVYCAAKKNPIAVHSVPSMGFFFIISIKLRFFYHLLLVNQDINQLSYGYQCCYITLFQFCSNLIINDAVAFCITDGLLLLSDDMILGILAHEIGHLSYGHTVIQLLIGGGNIFISGCLLLIKISYWIFSAIMGLFAICAISSVRNLLSVRG